MWERKKLLSCRNHSGLESFFKSLAVEPNHKAHNDWSLKNEIQFTHGHSRVRPQLVKCKEKNLKSKSERRFWLRKVNRYGSRLLNSRCKKTVEQYLENAEGKNGQHRISCLTELSFKNENKIWTFFQTKINNNSKCLYNAILQGTVLSALCIWTHGVNPHNNPLR